MLSILFWMAGVRFERGGEKGALVEGFSEEEEMSAERTVIFVQEGSEKDEHENWCVGKSSAPLVRSLSRGGGSENQKITKL